LDLHHHVFGQSDFHFGIRFVDLASTMSRNAASVGMGWIGMGCQKSGGRWLTLKCPALWIDKYSIHLDRTL
jgi:hypothetical protein